jgi:hypothetical protein
MRAARVPPDRVAARVGRRAVVDTHHGEPFTAFVLPP